MQLGRFGQHAAPISACCGEQVHQLADRLDRGNLRLQTRRVVLNSRELALSAAARALRSLFSAFVGAGRAALARRHFAQPRSCLASSGSSWPARDSRPTAAPADRAGPTLTGSVAIGFRIEEVLVAIDDHAELRAPVAKVIVADHRVAQETERAVKRRRRSRWSGCGRRASAWPRSGRKSRSRSVRGLGNRRDPQPLIVERPAQVAR